MSAWVKIGGVVAVALAAGCQSGTPLAGRSIDTGFGEGQVGWDTGASLAIYLAAQPVAGRVAVCGAYAVRNESAVSSGWNDDLLAASVVQLGGKTVLHDLSFLPLLVLDAGTNPIGRSASCRQTEQPWAAAYDGQLPRASTPPLQVVVSPGQIIKARTVRRIPMILRHSSQ